MNNVLADAERGGEGISLSMSRVGVLFSVQVTDDVVETVADDEPFHAQHRVVAPHLVEHLLCQRHRGRLVLDDHLRLAVETVEHAVAAARHPIDGQRHLVAQ